MVRNLIGLLLGLFLFFPVSGQKQKSNYKSVKLFSPVLGSYPTLSISVENFSFTKPVSDDEITVTEDGLKAKVEKTEFINSGQILNLYFFLFDQDSINTVEYIKNMESLERLKMIPNIILFNDTSIVLAKSAGWLKNARKLRGIFDTLSFNRLSNTVLGLFHKPGDVFVMLTGDLNLEIANSISKKIDASAVGDPPFVMFVSRNIKDVEVASLLQWADPRNIAIIPASTQKGDLSPLKSNLKSIMNPSQVISWRSPKPLNLNTSRLVKVKMKDKVAELKIMIPDTLIKKYFTLQTISSVDSLYAKGEYQSCLKLINERYATLKSPNFVKKTQEILGKQLEYLVIGKGSVTLASFLSLESLNTVPLGKDYQQDKLKHIKELYSITDKSDTLQKEQLSIAEYLQKISPQDPENKFRIHYSKGKLNDSQGNNLAALDEYRLALSIRKDEKSKSEITRLINISLNKFYREKEWNNIKRYSQTYSDYIKQSFMLMYYYGRASFELTDYDVAITQFNWLLDNWQDNKEVTFDRAFDYLQNACTFSFRFNEASSMCQTVFSEKQDKKSLDLAILNLRLSWIRPAMEAFNIWLKKIPAGIQPEKSISLNRVSFPGFIGSIRLCGADAKTVGTLFENKAFPTQPQAAPQTVKNTPSFLLENNSGWFTSGTINGRSVIIFLNNGKTDEQENNLLASIRKEPTNSLGWDQLSRYEEKIGSRFLCQLYTEIIASNTRMNGIPEAESYSRVLFENEAVLYNVLHGRDGAITYQKGFDLKKANYSDVDWKKSSLSTTVYLIEMKYDKSDVYDITNPVYGNKGWEGALRIGIKKQ